MTTSILSVLFWALAAPAPAASVAREFQEELASLARAAKPAVVNISTVREEEIQVLAPDFFFGDPEDFFGAPRRRTYKYRSGGVGSGFLIDASGHVLTNDHVVQGAAQIRVTLTKPDGTEETLKGKVIGRDPNLDLAVVQILAKRDFPFLRLGDSSKVRVGDFAVAIGSPFSLEQTVTSGIISAVRQTLTIEGRPYVGMLQTDAAINQGNSGGPLLDLDGAVIGVNTAIYSPSGAFAGIGFSIPANEVKLALEYLLAGKARERGWLGVEVAPIDELMRRRFRLPGQGGALVNAVVAQSPAEKAGLKRGDVVIRLEGSPVQSPQDLVARVTRLAPGASVSLGVHRKGRELSLDARLGERPEAARSGKAASREEEDAEDAPPGGFSWEGAFFEQTPEGVRVERIAADSALAGTLQNGDILRGIDENPIESLEDLQAASRASSLKNGVVLDVLRNGKPLYLSLKTG